MEESMAEQIDADLEALKDDIGKMRADLTKLSESFQSLLRHGGTEAYDRVRESAERMRDEVWKTGQSLTKEIEGRPVASAVTAFIAGMFLGALFSRRS
jgi:ElaB/YqjD/DUF883 family membrane-anchored ribosome-binding protein